MNKRERQEEIERLLLSSGRRWSSHELKERFNVDRATIWRDLKELIAAGKVKNEGTKYYIDSNCYISNIKMNMHEKLALHLATRLLVRKSDIASEHFSSLLKKLEGCFAKYSPKMAAVVSDTCNCFREKDGSKVKSQWLEILNTGWAEEKKVHIKYRSSSSDSVKTGLYGVYYLEPYAEGLSLHVVAYDFEKEKIVDLKFERIEKVCLSTESYKIPDDFCASEYFKEAWGIWVEDVEPVTVKLRFDGNAGKRVLENRWHPLQEIIEKKDNSVLWSCRVKQPKEMVPWIRSWGSGVEVLEPTELREEVRQEAIRMAEIYS